MVWYAVLWYAVLCNATVCCAHARSVRARCEVEPARDVAPDSHGPATDGIACSIAYSICDAMLAYAMLCLRMLCAAAEPSVNAQCGDNLEYQMVQQLEYYYSSTGPSSRTDGFESAYGPRDGAYSRVEVLGVSAPDIPRCEEGAHLTL
jgi:hypothetical protein